MIAHLDFFRKSRDCFRVIMDKFYYMYEGPKGKYNPFDIMKIIYYKNHFGDFLNFSQNINIFIVKLH